MRSEGPGGWDHDLLGPDPLALGDVLRVKLLELRQSVDDIVPIAGDVRAVAGEGAGMPKARAGGRDLA